MTPTKQRRTWQQEQERLSRHQFEEFLEGHGWVADDIHQDLGEDLLVRIYHEGISTGMAFFVQIKSTKNLAGHCVKEHGVSYRFPSKDLIHWQDSATPVVLVIWDVKKRIGVWSFADDVISDLDHRNPGWKQRSKVSVRLPIQNQMDDAGLKNIRFALARHYLPSVARGRDIEFRVEFGFPQDATGQGALDALKRHFSTGEEVRVDGKYIRKVYHSDWWTRLFGEADLTTGYIVIGPTRSREPTRVRFDLLAFDESQAFLPYVELRSLRSGTDEVLLSNEGQPTPFQVSILLRHPDRSVRFTFSVRDPGIEVKATLITLRFLVALSKGGKLTITNLELDRLFDLSVPAGLIEAPATQFVELITKLCVIQDKTGFPLTLRPDWSITHEELRTIDELYEIVTTGRTVHEDAIATIALMNYDPIQLRDICSYTDPTDLRMVTEETALDLFDAQIPLGRSTRLIRGRITCDDLLSEDSESTPAQPPETAVITVQTARIVHEFDRWLSLRKESA